MAWYANNSGNTTHAVKTKTANGRGLYDLSGNLWEWVWDRYQGNYEALPATALPVTDPMGPLTQQVSDDRVVRGGSWDFAAPMARCDAQQQLVLGWYLQSRHSVGEV